MRLKSILFKPETLCYNKLMDMFKLIDSSSGCRLVEKLYEQFELELGVLISSVLHRLCINNCYLIKHIDAIETSVQNPHKRLILAI